MARPLKRPRWPREREKKKLNLTFSPIPPTPPHRAAGQRHVPHPGGQEPDERRGVHGEGLVRGVHQVPEEQGHGGAQHAGHLLEDEGAREEAAGEAREAGRRPDQPGQEVVPQEARQPRAGPQRVQGHG